MNPLSKSSLFGLGLLLAISGQVSGQNAIWGGYTVSRTGWATTEENFLGRVNVGRYADALWVRSEGIGSHFYLPESHLLERGAWAYAPYLGTDRYQFQWADSGWLHIPAARTWAWAAPETLAAGKGWLFILNGRTAIAPAQKRFLTAQHSAAPPLYDISPPGMTNVRHTSSEDLDRMADALHLDLEQMLQYVEHDAEVEMSVDADGLTFRSTASIGNRYARIFYHPVEGGTIDFSALNAYTGKANFTVRAAVDLSNATGGFYCNIKHLGIRSYVEATPGIPDYIRDLLLEQTDAGTYSRIAAGIKADDVLLENHANEWTDPVFIEFTLPPQGSVTLKEVFLHLETEIRGFAGMEQRITGGHGALPENIHTVTNVVEMQAALDAVRDSDGPSIIYVDGTLSLTDWEAIGGHTSRQFSVGEGIRNLSVIGVADRALLDGLGFKVHGSNIIFENLTIRYLWMRNAFEINDGRYIRVSYCTMHGDLSDPGNRFDEFISVKNQARYVIISWNYMHSDLNGRGILIGSNDAEESMPDRKVIIHHNWFQRVGSRHPLVRGGYSHIYNNYFDRVNWGANVRTRAKSRIENNYFVNLSRSIFPGEEPEIIAGKWELAGNIFDRGDTRYQPTESTIQLQFEPGYTYHLDAAADVPDIVSAAAGAGRSPE